MEVRPYTGSGSEWDAFVHAQEGWSHFHQHGWRRLMEEALGHRTFHLGAFENGRLAGVLPLVLSTGAGAAGRNAIGSGVFGGTIAGTVLGILFVPLFYVVIRRIAPLRITAQRKSAGA